ncbi:MAG: InlB B-repeat-containing protein [Oscillospiraceae bacterium]|nr:InlB B-repeat-containing protein [Oscillospiraceae bacterium]
MKKSIAENCIRYISTATALILALAMLCCANFSAGAKSLGSNLTITDTTSLLADIDTTTNTTPAKTKDLIASGAGVEVIELSTSNKFTSGATIYFDTSGQSGWASDDAIIGAIFYYQDNDNWCYETSGDAYSDSNISKKTAFSSSDVYQTCTLVETNIYKVTVPASTLGSVRFLRINKSNGTQLWNYSSRMSVDAMGTNNCVSISGWDNTGSWSTYSGSDPVDPDPDPVVTDENLLSVLKGEKVMVYGGEKSEWKQTKYYFMSNNNTGSAKATVSLSITRNIDVEHIFGVATLSTDIQYYQGHWASGLLGAIEAGGTYIVRDKKDASAFEQLAVKDNNYLYSYDAGSTKTATTTIDATVNVGGKLSVSTSTQPGKSSLGLTNRFKYYLYDGTNYTEVSLTDGKVDTSTLPVGTGYKLLTVLYDKNIYVLADTDTFSVVNPTPDLATGVTLTSVPEAVEKNTSLTLTAELQNKHSSAGDVTYTFTETTGLGGTFGSDTSVVTTSASSASVTFSPTAEGTYSFKVVASSNGYKSVETTVDVVVSDEVNYYITGRFNEHKWGYKYLDMPFTKVSNGLYMYESGKTVAELSGTINETYGDKDQFFYIHTGNGNEGVWYGGSSNSGHTFHNNTKDNKFTLKYRANDTNTEESRLLKFLDTTATTKKDVVIWLDTTDSSNYKLWYEYTTPTKYSITYTDDGKGTVSGPAEALANATVSVSDLTITPNEGYELDTLTFNGTAFTDSFNMPEEAVTVKATFKPKTYYITYTIDSKEETLSPATYTIESPEITLPSPASKPGYTFSGWHIGSTTGSKTDKIPSGSTGDRSFYGTYDPIEYTVTFNPNGGTVDPTSKKVKYKEKYGDLPSPTKPNYSFIGWYLGEEPNDVQITKDSEYNTVGNVELKAKYAANPTITVKIMYEEAEAPGLAQVKGDGKIAYNGSSTVEVIPADGYYIYNIEPQDSFPYNVTKGKWTHDFTNLTADVTITITLKDNPTVNVEVYYGDVSPTDKATVKINNVVQSSAKIEYGDSAAFVVTPASGCYISSVVLTDYAYSPKSGEWTYTIQHVEGDKNIKVYLSDNPKVIVTCIDSKTGYPITDGSVSATVNENPSTEEGISVEYGSNVALSASVDTPNSYQFNGFYNSNKTTLLSSSANYTLNSVTANTEIFAKFDKLHKITIQWTNLDELKFGDNTLDTASNEYEKYLTEGSQFTLTTIIEESSEYKLNASCFSANGLTGSYSTADSSNKTTKHYNCTVGSGDGIVVITPLPATYSGSGYWGDKVLKIDVTNTMAGNEYFTVEFIKDSVTGFKARMVRPDSTKKVFECPIPSGYTSFKLKRWGYEGETLKLWNYSNETSCESKTDFTTKDYSNNIINFNP